MGIGTKERPIQNEPVVHWRPLGADDRKTVVGRIAKLTSTQPVGRAAGWPCSRLAVQPVGRAAGWPFVETATSFRLPAFSASSKRAGPFMDDPLMDDYIINCGHHQLWSSSTVVIINCGHHQLWSSSSIPEY
jgi:hypothetical protein